MSTKTTVTWKDGMAFEVELLGHHFMIDAAKEHGGTDLGPSPKALLLSGLGGCTGMDVVSLLNKMRLGPFTLAMEIEGEQTDTHPKVYHKITLTYKLDGENLLADKVLKAIRLSSTQYCGVSAMLAKTAQITIRVWINGSEVPYEV